MRKIDPVDLELKNLFIDNKQSFEEKLLKEAVNVREKIEEIRLNGNINLLENAHKLVMYIIEKKDEELIAFANQEGKAWARYALSVAFKLEWIQAIRRTIWSFLYEYDLQHKQSDIDHFYETEKEINQKVDMFLNTFFLSYTSYKDKLIESQRVMVEHLSVPIIPINPTISVLPLIGEIDSFRSERIQEKLLKEIARQRIQTLIIDMSGVTTMEPDVIDQFLKIIDGVEMMGCKAVLTCLHPVVVKRIIDLGVTFGDSATIKGSLQQALQDYLSQENFLESNGGN